MRSNKSIAQESIFNDLLFSIAFSLVCSLFFMVIKREQDYLELFFEEGHWQDLLFRTFMSWVMIFLVKSVTHYLDVKKPWKTGIWMRLFLQFAYGFFCVVLIDFIVYLGYLEIKGIGIEATRYLHLYFLFICIYITIVNIYYNYAYFIALKPKKSGLRSKLKDQAATAENEVDKLVLYVRQKKLVYITISNKVHYAKNIDGMDDHWHHTLEESRAVLAEEDFHQVGRSHIIHRSIIDQLISDPENKRLEIVLKAPFNENIKVSRHRIAGFNEWWFRE